MTGVKAQEILFMSNLSHDVVESDILEYFNAVVPIKKIYIIYGPDGYSTGTGEVIFYSENDAERVQYLFNNTCFMGRFLSLEFRTDFLHNYEFLLDNIPPSMTTIDLTALFSPPLRLIEAAVLYNKDGSSTGKAKVTFPYVSLCLRSNINEEEEVKWQCKKRNKGCSYLIRARLLKLLPNKIRYEVCQSIYITDLNYDVEANDLMEYFSRYIDVMEATVFYNRDGTSTGTAEITFYRGKDMFPYIVQIVDKIFEDRLDSVWFAFIKHDCYETEYSNRYPQFQEIVLISNIENLHENAQSNYNYQKLIDNRWERKHEQVVNLRSYKKEDVKCLKQVDELISSRRIFNGKSLSLKTLRLKHFNSFEKKRHG